MLKRIIIVIVLAAVSGLIRAQRLPSQVLFDHISIPGAINSSQIADLIQDHHGFIWFAGDGLFRYDGYQFKNFKIVSDSINLGGLEINTLVSDSVKNKLYISTQSYGVVAYDYETNTFSVVPSKGGIPILSSVALTHDGTLWTCSFSNGLYYLKNDTLQKVNDQRVAKNSTSLVTDNSRVFINQQRKIYILKNETIVDSIQINYQNVDFPEPLRVSALSFDRNGQLWMGTERNGVLVYDTLRRTFTNYLGPDNTPLFNRINKILEDRAGLIWILTKANGVVIYSPEENKFINLKNNRLSEHSLSGNNCTSIIQDNTGIIWLGATGDINRYDPAKLKFKHIYNATSDSLILSDNMVRGVFEDTRGILWIGTDAGYINLYDRTRNQIHKMMISLPGNKGPIVPMYFAEYDAQTMLICTSVGLLQYNRQSRTFNYYKPLQKFTENRMVRQLLKRGDDLFFVQSGALIHYNTKTGTMKTYVEFSSGKQHAINATCLYIDSNGRFWVGASGGVALFNPDKGTFQFTPIHKDQKRPHGMYFMILSIQEHHNELWVGTFNMGLWKLTLKDGLPVNFKNFTDADGLPNNTVYSSLPDQRGNLWLSTNRGISKYHLATNSFVNFSVAEGLQNDEFNRFAFAVCRNGEFVFGGINGINLFNPEEIVLPPADYQPRLTYAEVHSFKDNELKHYNLFNKKKISLAYHQDHLDISFLIANYQLPRRCEAFAKLEGHDPDWHRVEGTQMRYANLKPGTYTLRVKTVALNGKEAETSLPIEIKNPFWKTWWFLLLLLLLTIGIVYLIIQERVKKAKLEKEKLEVLLKIRTHEIERSREELTLLNEKKDLIFSILSHDLRAPLTTLKGFLSLLVDDSRSFSKEEIRRHAATIRQSVTNSLDLIDNTLFWSLSQMGGLHYEPTMVPIRTIIENIRGLYSLTAEKKQIQLIVHCEDDLLVWGDENMIYVALRNVVSNALKFSPEGKDVTITAVRKDGSAVITITDEGIGMNETYVKKLMADEQPSIKRGTSSEKGTGLGLFLCKKFVSLNKGTLSVSSKENKGTIFVVTLPLAKV